jgi:hypothetical protein
MSKQCYIDEMCSKKYSESPRKPGEMKWNQKAAALNNLQQHFIVEMSEKKIFKITRWIRIK